MRLLAQGTRRRGARAGGRESAASCRRPFPARTGGSAGPARGSASLRTLGSFSRLVEKRRRSLRSPALERRPNRAEAEPMLGLTQLSNYLTLKGSFERLYRSQVVQVKYALESSRRDLQNALLCTVLVESLSSILCLKIANNVANFCQILLHL